MEAHMLFLYILHYNTKIQYLSASGLKKKVTLDCDLFCTSNNVFILVAEQKVIYLE